MSKKKVFTAIILILLFAKVELHAIEKPQNPFGKPTVNNTPDVTNTPNNKTVNTKKEASSNIKATTDKKVKKEEYYNPKTITNND